MKTHWNWSMKHQNVSQKHWRSRVFLLFRGSVWIWFDFQTGSLKSFARQWHAHNFSSRIVSGGCGKRAKTHAVQGSVAKDRGPQHPTARPANCNDIQVPNVLFRFDLISTWLERGLTSWIFLIHLIIWVCRLYLLPHLQSRDVRCLTVHSDHPVGVLESAWGVGGAWWVWPLLLVSQVESVIHEWWVRWCNLKHGIIIIYHNYPIYCLHFSW